MDLLTHWNRKSLFLSPELLIPTHAAEFAPFTDASGSEANAGAGAVFGKYWQAFFVYSRGGQDFADLRSGRGSLGTVAD